MGVELAFVPWFLRYTLHVFYPFYVCVFALQQNGVGDAGSTAAHAAWGVW